MLLLRSLFRLEVFLMAGKILSFLEDILEKRDETMLECVHVS